MIPSFKQAMDRLFERLGRKAVYRAKGSDVTVPIKVIVKSPDRIVDLREAQIHTPTHVIEMRVKESPRPKAGDDILLGEAHYRIQGEPRQDSHHLVWTLEVLKLEDGLEAVI